MRTLALALCLSVVLAGCTQTAQQQRARAESRLFVDLGSLGSVRVVAGNFSDSQLSFRYKLMMGQTRIHGEAFADAHAFMVACDPGMLSVTYEATVRSAVNPIGSCWPEGPLGPFTAALAALLVNVTATPRLAASLLAFPGRHTVALAVPLIRESTDGSAAVWTITDGQGYPVTEVERLVEHRIVSVSVRDPDYHADAQYEYGPRSD